MQDDKEATAMMNSSVGKEGTLAFTYTFNNGKVNDQELPMILDLARNLIDTETWYKTDKKYTKEVTLIGEEKHVLAGYSMKTCELAQVLNLKSDLANYLTIHSLLAEAISISGLLASERVSAYSIARAEETGKMIKKLSTGQTKEEVRKLVSTKIFPLGSDEITQALLSESLWGRIIKGIYEEKQEQKAFINVAIKVGAEILLKVEELKDSRDSSLRNIKVTRNGMAISRRNEGGRGESSIFCSTTNRMTSTMRGTTLNSRQARAVGMYVGTGTDIINAAITRLQQLDSSKKAISDRKKKVQDNNQAYYKRKAVSKFHPLSGAVLLAMMDARSEEDVKKGLDALITSIEALPGKVSVSSVPLPFFYFVAVARDLELDGTNKMIKDVGKYTVRARNVKAFSNEESFRRFYVWLRITFCTRTRVSSKRSVEKR